MYNSFATPWIVDHQASLPRDFPSKNTGIGCHFLLQEIFLRDETPVSCIGRQILYHWATWKVLNVLKTNVKVYWTEHLKMVYLKMAYKFYMYFTTIFLYNEVCNYSGDKEQKWFGNVLRLKASAEEGDMVLGLGGQRGWYWYEGYMAVGMPVLSQRHSFPSSFQRAKWFLQQQQICIEYTVLTLGVGY